MCGRFVSALPAKELARIFGTLNALPNLPANWNVAPTQVVAVVRRHPESGERRLDPLHWGLLPHFERAPDRARLPINARAETVARLPSFRGAFAKRRCLVPADAFYEWRRDGALKQPMAIARADGAPLALGGLWESWTDPASGHVTRTFCIVTTAPNATMATIHNRMPLVLEAADWPAWLGEISAAAGALLRPASESVLRTRPVGTRVNSVRNNDASLLTPMENEAAGGGPNPA